MEKSTPNHKNIPMTGELVMPARCMRQWHKCCDDQRC